MGRKQAIIVQSGLKFREAATLQHVIFLIHGIGDGTPGDDFDTFEQLLMEAYCRQNKANETEWRKQFKVQGIVWDPATTDPETTIYSRSFGSLRPSDRSLVSESNPFLAALSLPNTRAWRYFMTFFVGDAIAYVDEFDNGIRRRVWEQMAAILKPESAGQIPKFSVIGHSLGSVIAYDFVHALNSAPGKIFDLSPDPAKNVKLSAAQIALLQTGFCNLITLGSPIALFWMRRRDLWQNDFAGLNNPVQGAQRWLNFWDNEDIIAYPLRNFFSTGNVEDIRIEDIRFDTSIMMPWAHTGYWKNKALAERVAEVLE